MADAFDLRAEACRVLGLAGDADGEQGTTVEAVERGNDLALLRPGDFVAIAACQLEGGLVGLGAGVGEEHAVGEGGLGQQLGQAQGRLVGEHVGHVPELLRLFGQRLDQCRVGMAEHVHGDAAGEVHQLATALIPDSAALATHRNEGGRGENGNHQLVKIGALHRRVRNGHRTLLPWRLVGLGCFR
ncbi:hypothetical protein D3C86_1604080 [compost metagenome]